MWWQLHINQFFKRNAEEYRRHEHFNHVSFIILRTFFESVITDNIRNSGKPLIHNLGFSYSVLDKYIREGVCEDASIKSKIDYLHEKNKFKLELMQVFPNI